MAADLTTISVEVPGASAPNTLIKTTALRLDLSLNSLGAGTSQIWEAGVGVGIKSVTGFVHTGAVGGTTLTFQMGATPDTLSTAIGTTGLAAGDVFNIGPHTKVGGAEAGYNMYAASAAIDLTVTAAGTYTAGVIYLVIETIDIATLHASSILVGDGLV